MQFAKFDLASAKYPLFLLGIFIAVWIILAINPLYPKDWLLENFLVFITLPMFILGYKRLRFSNYCYSMLFIFYCLHEIGAHYTFSEVPYVTWLGLDEATAGRNHYDRLIHFLYGFLLISVIIEIMQARASLQGIWRQLIPLSVIMATSTLYEIIEWQAAEIFGGELGQAYLGTQGDIWDAQKDSALATLGAICGLTAYHIYQRIKKKRHPEFTVT